MAAPRIVLFDLETLPNMEEAMKVFPQIGAYPGLTLKAQINSIICCGYKVLSDNAITACINAWDFEPWQRDVNDDSEVVRAVYEVLKDADCVVTHNGRRFDWKFLQTRLLKHGFDPLHKIPHVDTCAVAKANLMTFNNRLGNVSEFLGLDKKMENGGWDLWVRVRRRDPEAMKIMTEYCMKDVDVLEGVFKRLRPLIKEIPNHNLFNIAVGMKNACPKCGSTRLKPQGHRYNATTIRKRWKCGDCGAMSSTDATDRLPRGF